jgi:hypothetical protein
MPAGLRFSQVVRLAVQDITDPRYRCIPAVTINGNDADPVYPPPVTPSR